MSIIATNTDVTPLKQRGLQMMVNVTAEHIERSRLEGKEKLLSFALSDLFTGEVEPMFIIRTDDDERLEAYKVGGVFDPGPVFILLLGYFEIDYIAPELSTEMIGDMINGHVVFDVEIDRKLYVFQEYLEELEDQKDGGNDEQPDSEESS